MKAPDAERATPRMQRMVTKMPTMTQATVVAELRKLKVPVHFAEGEADAATAELAQRRRGYMLSSGEWRRREAGERGRGELTSLLWGRLQTATTSSSLPTA